MTLIALAIALTSAITLCYAALCAVQPFGDCRKCRGLGFKAKTDRRGRTKRGRDCRRCQATGKRIRTGRRLHNYARRTWNAGNR